MTDCLVTLALAYGASEPYASKNVKVASAEEYSAGQYRVTTAYEQIPLTNPAGVVPFPQGGVFAFLEPDSKYPKFLLIPSTGAVDYDDLVEVVPTIEHPGYLGDTVMTGVLDDVDSEFRRQIDEIFAESMTGDIADGAVGALINSGAATKDALGDEAADNTSPLAVGINARIAAAIDAATTSDIIAGSTAGALTRGKWTRVDATAGTKAMTLANAAAARQVTIVEKSDASTNPVTIDLGLRGSAGTLILTDQFELFVLVADDDLNWYVETNHRTRTSITTQIQTVGDARYVKTGSGSDAPSLAPRYVQTLTTGLIVESPTNLRTGLSSSTYADGGYQQELAITVTGTAGSKVLTTSQTSKVAGLGSNKFSAVLNSDDGTNDFFVDVMSNNGSTQITLRKALTKAFSGTLSAKYDDALGQHLTRGGTKAMAQHVADASGVMASRGAILEGTWDARPSSYNVAWDRNAALIAYGISNSAAPIVRSEMTVAVATNVISVADRLPIVPNANLCAMYVGTHTTGHGATATMYAGGREAVVEFFTGTFRTSTSTATAQVRSVVTVDGNVVYDKTDDGFLNRIRVPIHRGNKVVIDVTNADGSIYYLYLSQLTLREAGVDGRPRGAGMKIVTLMDSWGSRYQSQFSASVAAKTGATVVDHSLGGTTTVWALDWFDTYVLAEKPDECWMDFAINDRNQPSGLNFTASDGSTKPLWPAGLTALQTKALWRANMQLLAQRCRDAGIKPVFIVQSGTASESQTQGLCDYASYIDQPAPDYPASITELADTTAYVNTVGKFKGKRAVVGTSFKIAAGPLATDAWANLAEDALVPIQRRSLSRASYAMATGVVIGTDSDADGLSDGLSLQSYGTTTGDTYTGSIVGGNQRLAMAYAASGASGNKRLKAGWTAVSGKEYLVVWDVINATASQPFADSVCDVTGSAVGITSSNGAVTTDASGNSVVCYRGTANASGAKYSAIQMGRVNGAARTFDVRKALVIDLALLFADAPNIVNFTTAQLAAFVLSIQP